MFREKIDYIDLERLQNCRGHDTIMRLMMAFNDIVLANQCMSMIKREKSPIAQEYKEGAGMYFVRLQFSHLNEAMKIMKKIRDTQFLLSIVKQCSDRGKENFEKLKGYLKGEQNYAEFENKVGKIRHNLTFHYGESTKLYNRALKRRSERQDGKISKITWSPDIENMRFNIADDIHDTIVCRQIWQIPEGANIREEANKFADFGHEVCVCFLEFAYEIICRYLQHHGLIN